MVPRNGGLRRRQTYLDHVRIDLQAMSQAEIEADYEMRTDQGIKDFLEWTQGRLFEPRNIPPGFRGGTLLSKVAGTLENDIRVVVVYFGLKRGQQVIVF